MTTTDINAKRPSVFYTVNIEHRWDGTFGLSVSGIGDDPSPRSRNSVACALIEAVKIIDPSVIASQAHERPVDPEDIDAVAGAIRRESGAGIKFDEAQRMSVAAIVIARGNHNASNNVVGYQVQRIDPDEGPSIWRYVDEDEFKLRSRSSNYNVRELTVVKGSERAGKPD